MYSRENREWIDCHSHVIPGIDDGSRSIEESLEILRQFKAEGVGTIFATPHFYPDDNIDDFLVRRDEAYNQLMSFINEGNENVPIIRRGAEVYLGVDTPQLLDLEKLCIEGTRYILIELPNIGWPEWVYEALYTIKAKYKITPLIAHIERYESIIKDLDKFYRLVEMDVVTQMNAYALLEKKKAFAIQLVKNDMIHVLGSDAHRARTASGVIRGYEVITQKLGSEQAEKLAQNAEILLNDQLIDKLEPKPIKKVLGFYL